jgi:hypothetical protein
MSAHHRGDLLACTVWSLYQRLGLTRTRRVLHAAAWTLDQIANGYRVSPKVRARIWARVFELKQAEMVHS